MWSPRWKTEGGKGKIFLPTQTIKWIDGWLEDEPINITYSKYSEILMEETRLRDIWVWAQNSFNCASGLKIFTIRCLDKLKGRKEKVLAGCYFVLKKREPDARRLTSEIQTY